VAMILGQSRFSPSKGSTPGYEPDQPY